MSHSFEGLGLVPELVRAVADEGYTVPTPIQVQAIPVILAGRDVLAGAQTGTGKTAGFTLPLLQLLAARPNASPGPHPVRALVVTPTRELAAQVEESIRTYGKYLTLTTTLVYGGVGINPQIDALADHVDVLVATPGRLLDHAGQETVDLSRVEILVLDEADRMLDMGFIHDIRRILALLPPRRQNLLFSATFPDEIRELAASLLHDPAEIQVAPRRNAESELVAQRVYFPVPQHHKRALLAHLVRTGDWRQVLVFTRTKHGANRLAEQLCKDGIEATAIHGNKSQGARTRALAGFKSGDVRVLVATDIASRGLDIEELPHVVNYELPHVPEDYVHRIGRTGRAGSVGEAISLVSPEEKGLLGDIERLLGREIDRAPLPEYPVPAASQGEPRPPAEGGGESRRGRERRSQGARNQQKPRRPQEPSRPQDPRREQQARRQPPQPHAPHAQPQPAPQAGGKQWDDDVQPTSHESALGKFPQEGRRPTRGRRQQGQGPLPALLRGTPRRSS